MILVAKAAAFAALAHKDQFRKDGVTPYFYHCAMVAYLVQKHCDPTDEMVAAAFLHDVVEDCGVSTTDLTKEFGIYVSGYVHGLTNVYTKHHSPNLNREERKRAECRRLSNLSTEVKQIKLADRLANVIDLSSLEKGFQEKFVNETHQLLKAIGDVNSVLTQEIRKYI